MHADVISMRFTLCNVMHQLMSGFFAGAFDTSKIIRDLPYEQLLFLSSIASYILPASSASAGRLFHQSGREANMISCSFRAKLEQHKTCIMSISSSWCQSFQQTRSTSSHQLPSGFPNSRLRQVLLAIFPVQAEPASMISTLLCRTSMESQRTSII